MKFLIAFPEISSSWPTAVFFLCLHYLLLQLAAPALQPQSAIPPAEASLDLNPHSSQELRGLSLPQLHLSLCFSHSEFYVSPDCIKLLLLQDFVPAVPSALFSPPG